MALLSALVAAAVVAVSVAQPVAGSIRWSAAGLRAARDTGGAITSTLISTWTSQTGGYKAVEANSNRQPDVVENALFCHSGLRFGPAGGAIGGGTILQMAEDLDNLDPQTGGFSVFALSRQDAYLGAGMMVSKGALFAANYWEIMHSAAGGMTRTFVVDATGAAANTYVPYTDTNRWNVWSFRVNNTGASKLVTGAKDNVGSGWFLGNFGATSNAYTGAVNASGGLRFGGSNAYIYRGVLVDVMIFSRFLDDAEMAAVQTWYDATYFLTCPTLNSVNADNGQDGKTFCSGTDARYWNECRQSCKAGFVSTYGETEHTCLNGEWSAAPLMCERTCPALGAPLHAGSCVRTLFEVGLVDLNGKDVTFFDKMWATWPLMPRVERSKYWNVQGGLIYSKVGTNPCAVARDNALFLASPIWQNNIAFSSTVTMEVDLFIDNGPSGMVVRWLDEKNHIRIIVNVAAFLHRIVLVSNGVQSEIANSTYLLSLGTTYNLKAVLAGPSIQVYDGSTLFLSGTSSAVRSGTFGLFSNGEARFMRMKLTSDCDSGMSCLNAPPGVACAYTCATGYTAVNGSPDRKCADDGSQATWGSTALVCSIDPPSVNTTAKVVKENSPEGTLVGSPVDASSNALRAVFSYAITAQVPTSTPAAFVINSCTGQLEVGPGALVDYEPLAGNGFRYDLTITVTANGDASRTGVGVVSVNVLDVNEPALFGSAANGRIAQSVFEDSGVGSVLTPGPASQATDPDANPLFTQNKYSFEGSTNPPAMFRVDAVTGLIYVNRSVLDYETHPEVDLRLRVEDLSNPDLSSVVTIRVSVQNVNEAPLMEDPQAIEVDETSATVGTNIRDGVDAKDPDAGDSVSFSISPSTAQNNNKDPADAATVAMFTIGLSNGLLQWLVDRSSWLPISIPQVVDGRLVRAVYNVFVTATDLGPKSNTALVKVYLMANLTASGMPTISSFFVQTPLPTVLPNTLGDEVMTITGTNFVRVPAYASVKVNLTSYDGSNKVLRTPYSARSCTIVNGVTIRCLTPPGVGTNLRVELALVDSTGTVVVNALFSNPLLLSYQPPVYASVRNATLYSVSGYPSTGLLNTRLGGRFYLHGTGFGIQASEIAVTYGPVTGTAPAQVSDWMTARVIASNGTMITLDAGSGFGRSLACKVTVAGQTFISGDYRLTFGYANPVIQTLSVPVTSAYNLSSMPTGAYSAVLRMDGVNFPPYSYMVEGRYTYPELNVFYGNALRFPSGCTYSSPGNGCFKMEYCYSDYTNPYSIISCYLPESFGWNHTVTVTFQDRTLSYVYSAASHLTAKRPNNVFSHSPPLISGVTGIGMRNAETQGGQSLIINGKWLGPLALSSNAAGVDGIEVRYGNQFNYSDTAANFKLRYQFSATACKVAYSDTYYGNGRVECNTGEGVGLGHAMRLSIGGQLSNTLSNVINYGSPIVASFAGAGATDALTSGNQAISVYGKNFGNDIRKVDVQYTQVIDPDRVASIPTANILPVGVIGTNVLTFKPVNCTYEANHTALLCFTGAGAGNNLKWRVIVDGQVSKDPFSTYGPAQVFDITVGFPASDARALPADNLDPNGGQLIYVTGQNFGNVAGPAFMLPRVYGTMQWVRYALPGNDAQYVPTVRWIVDSHTAMRMITAPGYGVDLSYEFMVGDQESGRTLGKFSYAKPTLLYILPANGTTKSIVPLQYRIQVFAKNLPWTDLQNRFTIFVGNRADGTRSTSAITCSRDATRVGTIQSVTCPMNSGIGRKRMVELHVDRLGIAGSDLTAVGIATFDYNDPAVAYISADSASDPLWVARVTLAMPSYVGQARVIQVFGADFGIGTGVVKRDVLFRNKTLGQTEFENWVPVALIGTLNQQHVLSSWTHDAVVFFTTSVTAEARLRITAKDMDAPYGNGTLSDIVQWSNIFDISTQLPSITSLEGIPAAGFATAGNELLTLNVPWPVFGTGVFYFGVEVGIGASREFCNVTDRNAQGVDTLYNELTSGAFIISKCRAQFSNVPTQDSVCKFTCVMPSHRGGVDVPVMIAVDAQKSGAKMVFFTKPVVNKVTVQDNSAGIVPVTTVYDVSGGGIVQVLSPTTDAVITIEGSNFGKCGTVIIGEDQLVDTCGLPDSARSHTKIVIAVPGGEGSMDVDSFGVMRPFALLVEQGNQFTDKLIPFSYMAPVFTKIEPNVFPTRGNVTVTISGRYFGEKNGNGADKAPTVTFALNDGLGDLKCDQVVRLSHYSVQCVVPEGTGAGLDVRMQTLDLIGTSVASGQTVSYQRPAITAAAVEVWPSALYADWPASWNVNRSAETYTWLNSTNAAGKDMLALHGPTAGRYKVVLTGTNFGAASTGEYAAGAQRSSCAMLSFNYADIDCSVDINTDDDRCRCAAGELVFCAFSWLAKISAAATDPVTGVVWGNHRCNGKEDFPGEGEIFDDHGKTRNNSTSTVDEIASTLQGQDTFGAGFILSWDHEEVVLLMPPGAGAHILTVFARNQGPLADSEVRFTYDAPVVQGVRSLSGRISTGPMSNDILEIYGSNFGRGFPAYAADDTLPVLSSQTSPFERNVGISQNLADNLKNQATLPVMWRTFMTPNGRPLNEISETSAVPGASLTLKWWLFCESTALVYRQPEPEGGWDANKALETFGCMINRNSTQYTILKHSQNSIIFRSHPGIGAGRQALLSVHSGSRVMSRTNFTFSYDVPFPWSVTPDVLTMVNEVKSDGENPDYIAAINGGPVKNILTITGMNFGEDTDLALYRDLGFITADEVAVEVKVDSTSGEGAARVASTISRSSISVQFAKLTVGRKDVSVKVAGQYGWMFKNSTWIKPLYVVCGADTFGHIGEFCLSCPIGAKCYGYSSIIEADTKNPVNLTDPVSANRPHRYPQALPEFYNLPAEACPTEVRKLYPDRLDVCIVGCLPTEACAGANFCSYGYKSVAPYYRCGSCDTGYYRRNNECVRCPDSPLLLIIGFVLLAVAMCGVGFVLNKKNVNIAFLSIAVDYVQVVSMFAASRIAWPPEIKELLHILSAFNLNIEIIAPECIKPDISYTQKWSAIMLLPISACVVFLFVFVIGYVWKRFVKGQKGRAFLLSHQDSLIAMYLILFYFMYLYVTRTLLEVFNCVQTEPDDGFLYMAAVFEPCGKAGGTQLFLMPMAIAGLLLYTAGYPIFCAVLLYKFQFEIMLDQLLRAKGTGDSQMSNPHAFHLRTRFSRLYYQYKPDYYAWMLFVLARKFMIAFTGLMFLKDGAFQLAVALLVLFAAYALQVKWEPFMSPSDRSEVLREHERSRFEGTIHTRLAESLKDAALKERKRTNKIDWTAPKAVLGRQILNRAGLFLFNYNTVEALLLGIAILICLAGIMFESLARRVVNNSSLASQRQCSPSYAGYCTGLMYGCIMLIAFSIVYLIVVITVEVHGAVQEASLANAGVVQRAKMAKKMGLEGGPGAAGTRLSRAMASVTKDGDSSGGSMDMGFASRIGVLETAVNPLFANAKSGNIKKKGEDDGMDTDSMLSAASIADMTEPPNPALWAVMRDTYTTLIEQSIKQRAQLQAMKKAMADVDSARAAETEREEELAAMYGLEPVKALDASSAVSPMGRGRRGQTDDSSQKAQSGSLKPQASSSRLSAGKKSFGATNARDQ